VYYLQRPEENPDEPLRANPHNVALRATPYDVGPMLAKILSFFPAKIVVSATMTTGGTFDYIRRQFGNVNQPAGPVASQTPIWTLRVPTPFNFAKQAKFIVPLGIPWPIPENADAFNAAALRAIEQVIHDCQGRTLVLFTSWRRLRYVAENLQTDYPVLVQGDLPARQLAQTFREDTHSVLLATRSFWTGLDVQGESLSCLVIDKLPMESLGDPLLDMLKEKHPDTFWDEFYFPRVAIELAQGAGRLIRSTSDRGAFVLLDSRILAKSYGKMLIRSLPFLGVSKNLADAGKFLSQP
jgi:ATP-dependent DNA helicase DinG